MSPLVSLRSKAQFPGTGALDLASGPALHVASPTVPVRRVTGDAIVLDYKRGPATPRVM